MSSLLKGIQDSSIEASQNYVPVEFTFAGVAVAAGGVRLVPVTQEAATNGKVIVQLGGSTNNASLAVTQAQMEALCMPEGAATAEITTLATGLVTWINAPAAYVTTNGNRAVTFAVGGLRANQIKKAELEFVTGGTSSGASVVKLIERSAATITSAATAVKTSYVLATDKLWVSRGVVGGSFAVPDITQVPASTGTFVLRLWVKN